MDNSVLNGVSPKGTKGMDQYTHFRFSLWQIRQRSTIICDSFSLMKFQAPLPHKLCTFNFIVELVFLKERLSQSHWNLFQMVWIMRAEFKNCLYALILNWIQNWFAWPTLIRFLVTSLTYFICLHLLIDLETLWVEEL